MEVIGCSLNWGITPPFGWRD